MKARSRRGCTSNDAQRNFRRSRAIFLFLFRTHRRSRPEGIKKNQAKKNQIGSKRESKTLIILYLLSPLDRIRERDARQIEDFGDAPQEL